MQTALRLASSSAAFQVLALAHLQRASLKGFYCLYSVISISILLYDITVPITMDITSRPDPLSESQASPAVPEVGSWVTTPRDVDVLSTKLRTLHRSKGNVFYRELVDKYAAKIDKKAVPDGTRQVAERIVDIITVDRKGVFLRRDGGATRWLVMDRRAAINKVFTAIRTYQAKASAGGTATDKKTCFKKKPPAATKMAGTAKKPPKVVSYQAQAGPVTAIRPYALHLISAVCNQPQTQEALLRVLDKPLLESTDEPEPSRDRTMRLQVRCRDGMINFQCIHEQKEILMM